MKKIKKLFMGLIFLLFCLSACSKGGSIENKDNTANEETKKESKKDKSKKKDNSKDKQDENDGSDAKKSKSSKVENNGGYFVAKDDLVYFRNYGEGLNGESALFGYFLGVSAYPDNAYICSYDIKSGEVKSEFEDEGFGELYLYKDTFYLKEEDTGNEGRYANIYSVKTDGSDRKDITHGDLLAMNPENGVYAVEKYENGVWLIELWQQDELIYSFKDDKDEHMASFIESGHTNEYVLFLKYSYDESKHPQLWALKLDKDGELKKIGTFNYENEDMDYSYPFIDQVVNLNDDVYFILTFRSGTSFTLQGAYLYKANLKEGIMEPLNESVSDGEEVVYEIWTDGSGGLKIGNNKPLSTWQYETDLMFCDEDGEEKILCPDLFEQDKDTIKILQKAEFVKGMFFVISCDAVSFEEDDIGSSETYKCIATHYYAVPTEGESPKELFSK